MCHPSRKESEERFRHNLGADRTALAHATYKSCIQYNRCAWLSSCCSRIGVARAQIPTHQFVRGCSSIQSGYPVLTVTPGGGQSFRRICGRPPPFVNMCSLYWSLRTAITSGLQYLSGGGGGGGLLGRPVSQPMTPAVAGALFVVRSECKKHMLREVLSQE